MSRLTLFLVLVFPLCAPRAALAFDCDGDPGFVLDVSPNVVAVGSTVQVNLSGPPNSVGLLMVSTGQGPTPSSYGDICLDFPLLFQIVIAFPSSGQLSFSFDTPLDCSIVDFTIYLQFLVCAPFRNLSNQESLTFSDANLGDLPYGGCVDSDLLGLTVREVIGISDFVISGALGQCDGTNSCQENDIFDVDGDGSPDVSIAGLKSALDTFNNNFLDCDIDAGCLDTGGCGGFCSYTPGGWGSPCSGNNAGCLRDLLFDTLFPAGLVIGDQDGADADTEYSLTLTAASAVEAFLSNSNNGTPATLDQDAVDSTSSSAGSFADHLVAAKLNLALDDAGLN